MSAQTESWMGQRGAELAGKGDRYLRRGGVRHRTRPSIFESFTRIAACGITGGDRDWFGTGSQDEYERLAAIPRCTRCIAAEKAAL